MVLWLYYFASGIKNNRQKKIDLPFDLLFFCRPFAYIGLQHRKNKTLTIFNKQLQLFQGKKRFGIEGVKGGRRGSRILVRGAQWSLDPKVGALSPKFAQNRGFPLKIPSKLHNFEEILGARRARAPRAPWIRFWVEFSNLRRSPGSGAHFKVNTCLCTFSGSLISSCTYLLSCSSLHSAVSIVAPVSPFSLSASRNETNAIHTETKSLDSA